MYMINFLLWLNFHFMRTMLLLQISPRNIMWEFETKLIIIPIFNFFTEPSISSIHEIPFNFKGCSKFRKDIWMYKKDWGDTMACCITVAFWIKITSFSIISWHIHGSLTKTWKVRWMNLDFVWCLHSKTIEHRIHLEASFSGCVFFKSVFGENICIIILLISYISLSEMH